VDAANRGGERGCEAPGSGGERPGERQGMALGDALLGRWTRGAQFIRPESGGRRVACTMERMVRMERFHREREMDELMREVRAKTEREREGERESARVRERVSKRRCSLEMPERGQRA
jgi:hypothetical protein